MKLKKNIGKLEAGLHGLITHETPSSRINKLLKARPDLAEYFEDEKSTKKSKATKTEEVLVKNSSDKD